MVQLAEADKQWIFTPEELADAPSRQDGVTLEEELKQRKETIEYMRKVAQRAHSDLFADRKEWRTRGFMSVGAAMVHRFFMRRSVNDFEPHLMAATVLFLASKVDEEPIKLRHIVNAVLCLHGSPNHIWQPDDSQYMKQTTAYQRWEQNILITEEIVLDTLCFDMALQHSWTVLRRATKGFDTLLEGQVNNWRLAANGVKPNGSENTSARAGEVVKRKTRLTEMTLRDVAWMFTYEGLLSPMPVLAPAPIFACATFALTVAAIDQLSLSEAFAIAGEFGPRFGLDLRFDEKEGAIGSDAQACRACVDQYLQYAKSGLIPATLATLIDVAATPTKYERWYT